MRLIRGGLFCQLLLLLFCFVFVTSKPISTFNRQDDKGVNQRSKTSHKHKTESPTVTLTWNYACKYRARYINSTDQRCRTKNRVKNCCTYICIAAHIETSQADRPDSVTV